MLSVEELPLLFLRIYFSRASASRSLTRLANGDSAVAGLTAGAFADDLPATVVPESIEILLVEGR